MRALLRPFFDDLKNSEGLLHPILARVKKDETLMLAIRDGYINIYYRGGNILKIEQMKEGYRSSFSQDDYNICGEADLDLLPTITSQTDAEEWVGSFPALKAMMDFYLFEHRKPEREFQQLVARENNSSTISNETEYFISDIELADSDLCARFDMLAVRWSASNRKSGGECRAALIEMKYGDGALGKGSGLLEHLQDIDSLVSDDKRYASLLGTMETQFNQLDELELLDFNRCSNGPSVKLSIKDKPEVIIILANHNPRSTKLRTILNDPRIDEYAQKQRYDLRFHVAQFSGYGMHAKCMLGLADFRKFL